MRYRTGQVPEKMTFPHLHGKSLVPLALTLTPVFAAQESCLQPAPVQWGGCSTKPPRPRAGFPFPAQKATLPLYPQSSCRCSNPPLQTPEACPLQRKSPGFCWQWSVSKEELAEPANIPRRLGLNVFFHNVCPVPLPWHLHLIPSCRALVPFYKLRCPRYAPDFPVSPHRP